MDAETLNKLRSDPLVLCRILWPHVEFYDKQREVIYSVRDNDETIVTAGHKLGKDFVTAFIILWYYLVHHPCRIITTSVKDDHLIVLWGEMIRFIDSSKFPLTKRKGGPLLVMHRDIRKIERSPEGVHRCPISYLKGMVSEKGEGMAGHHAPYTLFVCDEASGVADLAYERADTWAKKKLIIGNPYPAANNFFERGVKGGDILAAEAMNYVKQGGDRSRKDG
jgi:phage terminase large subunit